MLHSGLEANWKPCKVSKLQITAEHVAGADKSCQGLTVWKASSTENWIPGQENLQGCDQRKLLLLAEDGVAVAATWIWWNQCHISTRTKLLHVLLSEFKAILPSVLVEWWKELQINERHKEKVLAVISLPIKCSLEGVIVKLLLPI